MTLNAITGLKTLFSGGVYLSPAELLRANLEYNGYPVVAVVTSPLNFPGHGLTSFSIMLSSSTPIQPVPPSKPLRSAERMLTKGSAIGSAPETSTVSGFRLLYSVGFPRWLITISHGMDA